jgi:hypothetical protein
VPPHSVLAHKKVSVPLAQVVGWDSGPFSAGAENLAQTGFEHRTVHPVAQSPYRILYPAHKHLYVSTYCNHILLSSLVPSLGMKSLAQFCTSSLSRWLCFYI